MNRLFRKSYEHSQFSVPMILAPRDEVLFAALDELAPTVVAVMVLFAVMNVPVFLYLGDLHCGHTSLMIMASVDLYGIGKRFAVNGNIKPVGEHYLNIPTTPTGAGPFHYDRLPWRRAILVPLPSIDRSEVS
jgi:hypothetical protein